MKRILFLIVTLSTFALSFGQEHKKVKNIILLIPDGTSSSMLTLTRWYKGNQPLAVDKIICGMVKTNCIDERFPDSAPTSTAYATGEKSLAAYVGVDSASVPHISVLEMAKLKGLSTGVVVTCEYPHATPADFVCHFSNRRNYQALSQQFVYNSPDLFFGGGKGYLDTINKGATLKTFHDLKYKLITTQDQLNQLQSLNNQVVWGLFPNWVGSTSSMSLQIDREINSDEPSLSEMTRKAIELLSQNEKGFFLMVEGSQIDWACHNNDPYGAITEFKEFDNSVKVALDFAERDSSTIVIVVPDHGNGGLSLGNSNSNNSFFVRNITSYDRVNIRKDIIEPLYQIHYSARKLAYLIIDNSQYASYDSLSKYYNITDTSLTYDIQKLVSRYPPDVHLADTIQHILGRSYSKHNFIGWTTTGHTAEDVFLGIYAPVGVERKTGILDNTEIGEYIAEQLQLGKFDELTHKYFMLPEELFKNDPKVSFEKTSESLVIKKNKITIVIPANSNILRVRKGMDNWESVTMPTISVCIPRKSDGVPDYYISEEIIKFLN